MDELFTESAKAVLAIAQEEAVFSSPIRRF